MHATSTSRELSYDIGAIFCSREKASMLSTVATSACKQTLDFGYFSFFLFDQVMQLSDMTNEP